MEKGVSVEFPNELLENRFVESTFISSIDSKFGVSALSEEEDGLFILRLYQLLQGDNKEYFPVQELAAFSFQNRRELTDFLIKLPNLSAIDMLMLLNPLPGEFN